MIPRQEAFVYYSDNLDSNEAVTMNEDGSYSFFGSSAITRSQKKEIRMRARTHKKPGL